MTQSTPTFRPDLVNFYMGRFDAYLAMASVTNAAISCDGAVADLERWAHERGTDLLTVGEATAVRFAIAARVNDLLPNWNGEKRIESVKIVRQDGRVLVVEVLYSDRIVASGTVEYVHGAVRRNHAWERGGGWPAVSFEAILAAERRWRAC